MKINVDEIIGLIKDDIKMSMRMPSHGIKYYAVSRVPVPVPENFKLGCRLPVPEGNAWMPVHL